MRIKKAFFTTLFAILLTACVGTPIVPEVSSVEFVGPLAGTRFTDVLPEGQILYKPLILRLTSNYPDTKNVRVFVNEVGPVFCALVPDIEKECGQIPLLSHGDQTVRVEMDIFDGNIAFAPQSASLNFTWLPYEGWDLKALSLASVLGQDDPATGYFLFALLWVAGLSLLGFFLLKRSWLLTYAAGWSSLAVLTIAFGFSGSLIAQGLVLGLGMLCFVGGILGSVGYFAHLSHERAQHTVVLPPTRESHSEDSDVVDASFFWKGDYLPQSIPFDEQDIS